MSALDVPTRVASFAGGQLLAAMTRVASARPAAKPLHPRGRVARATLRRFGADPATTGVAWLDLPGEDEVVVRVSRAIGVPEGVPDVFGLAVRVPVGAPGAHGDVLFASTGQGPLTRFTLLPARSLHGRPLTTLLPYRTAAGPLLLSAVFRDERTVSLSWAVGTGRWHAFGELRVPDAEPGNEADALVSFDPVANPVPGLDTYDWTRLLREPAYATARLGRQRAAGAGPGPEERRS